MNVVVERRVFVLAIFLLQPAIAADVGMSDSGHERAPLRTVIPDYPDTARRDRIEGEVQVCFEISRAGRPRRIAVRRSSSRTFEKPAIRAVRESTFEPLSRDEELPTIKACRTFRFILEPVPGNEPA